MDNYIERLTALPPDATFKDYIALRASLLWLAHARPDTAAFASLVGSNTEADFDAKLIVEINSQLAKLKESRQIMLTFPKLDPKTLRLVVYADGSFANRKDKGSQLGYVICLTDASGAMCIIQFKSHKAYRVVKSAMAAETLAFAAAFDSGFLIRRQIEIILDQDVPLLMLTDSKCLFDVLTSNKNTTEGRLMLDIFAARQAYSRREIDNIGLIKSEVNLADDLTKMKGNGALARAMQSSRLDHRAEDYILRGKQ